MQQISYVLQLMTYLVNACEEINEESKHGCTFTRIEDILRNPAKTFQVTNLTSPNYSQSVSRGNKLHITKY